MLNSNLLQIVSKLNSSEIKEFGDYVRSPFFNKNEGVIKLYDYIKVHHPDYNGMNFEKEFVYKKLFPKVEYDDAFMRKLMFNLAKLAEDFLSYEYYSKDKFNYYTCLLNQLNSKDLDRIFNKKLNSMEDEFGKLKIKDAEYYRIRNQIDVFRSFIVLKGSAFVNAKDKPDSILIRENESLVNFFLIKILAEYRFLFNFKKMMKFEFESEFHKDIIAYLKKNESIHNVPLLSIYFNSLLLIIEKDESYFHKVKEIALKEMDSLTYDDKYTTFALLVNYSNDEYHKGNQKYLNERHELHKLILQYGLHSGIGARAYFNDVLFKNIVTVGLLLKEIEWTEQFVKDHVNNLYPDFKDNALSYNTALINFAKGNYEKSLEDLNSIASVRHFHYKPSIKALSLMICIEKGWYDQAYDIIDTYRHFITNDKMLPGFKKERNANFIKFCNEILKLKSKNSKEKIIDVKFDLINTENILEKEWLLEKVEEMELKTAH